ncbi:MAG: ABC transporter permease [Clostridiales bacterium]|jgi:peptide/nickel transport system permease protein|nr:ABC transporter permease [Clostridiales bacterium]
MNKKVKAFFNLIKGVASDAAGVLVKIWRHRKGRIGLIMVGLIILAAALAPLLAPYDPKTPNITEGFLKPSAAHLLGTDANGIDILSQLIYGARVSLMIGMISGVSVTLIGAVLGIVSGYFGAVADNIVMRIVDVLLVIPTLPLMIILNNYVSSSYLMMIFIFVVFGWPGTARIIRAQVMSMKNINYIKAAELAGAGKGYIMFKHILPAVSHLLIMNCALASAGLMIAEAGMSFLGLGDPGAVSWGQILVRAEKDAFTSRHWAWVLAPGLAIFFTVIGFMQLGYALEDIFNPRMGKSGNMFRQFRKIKASDVAAAFDSMDDIDFARAVKIKSAYGGGDE